METTMKMHRLPRSEGNLATGVRTIFLVTLIGLIAAVTGLAAFGPQPEVGLLDRNFGAATEGAPNVLAAKSDAKETTADPATYFPAQFVEPKGQGDDPPPSF